MEDVTLDRVIHKPLQTAPVALVRFVKICEGVCVKKLSFESTGDCNGLAGDVGCVV